VHATRPHIAKLALISYCAVLSAIYIFALANAPLSLLSAAGHDDGLFIAIGRYLAARQWLGPYNEFTLAKGPGYPAFLAFSYLFGLSSSLARALFHCGAIALFVALSRRWLRSYLLAALLFTLLLWDPASFLGQNLRLLRDTIYYGQVLVAFGLLAHALLGRNLGAGIIGGLVLGWAWLTREEGLWLAPALALLAAAGAYRAIAERAALRFGAAGLAAVAAFAAVNGGFRAMNWKYYGAPVGVEYKEPNFVRALGAIHSVRSGEVKPFVSVTRATRQKIYPVSPSFAQLGSDLDGALGERWQKAVCDSVTCDEVNSAVFAWALRDAAARAGHHRSPAEASAFYGRIADEIGAACENKQLDCKRQVFAELPPDSWSQLAILPQRALKALVMVFYARWQSVDGVPSLGLIEQFRADLAFLHYPFMKQPDAASGDIRFEAASSGLSELFQPQRPNAISYRLRETVMRNFEFVRVPLLIVGLVAAFVCIARWRVALLDPAYVLALTMWALAGSRILLIALLDATFYSGAINPVYLAPAGFAITAAAVLSIAAWRQLRGRTALTDSAAAPLPPLRASASG
jgi:hypothetical protein